MIRFFSPDIETDGLLPADESGHCIRVLRHRVGDVIEAVDGKGHLYRCQILDADPRRVKIEILEKTALPPHWGRKITIAVAPTKNMDRMEWFVEKAVEIGVDRIVLLRCDRSERKAARTDRLRRVMASAMKQSLKASIPELEEAVPFAEFVTNVDHDAYKCIAYCDKDTPRSPLLSIRPNKGQETIVLIGPEGDFSPTEVSTALKAGFRPVTMGDSRLRTETAALVALTALHINELEQ